MAICEEVGPRWDEGCKRGKKGEEPRCCEFGNEEMATGQSNGEAATVVLAAAAVVQVVSPARIHLPAGTQPKTPYLHIFLNIFVK